MIHRRIYNQSLTDTGESGREYFRLGAESYSSLGRVKKKEGNSVSTFGRFRVYRLRSKVDALYIFEAIGR